MPLPEEVPSPELVAPKKEPFFYGGQAVIEGVMMRGRRHYAVAVRLPTTKQIVVDRGELKAQIYVNPFWKLPFVRGLALIGEQLHLGMKSLLWSVNMNAGERDVALEHRRVHLARGVAELSELVVVDVVLVLEGGVVLGRDEPGRVEDPVVGLHM